MNEDKPDRELPKAHYESGIPILPGLEDKAEAVRRSQEQEHEANRKRELRTNERIAVFTGALVVCTLITAAISAWQTWVAEGAASTSMKAVLIAQRSERQAVKSSDEQSRQSARVLKNTIDTFHQEQRAWVVVSKIDPDGGPLKNGSHIAARITFTNVGKTPALRTVIETADMMYTPDHEPNLRIIREKGFKPWYQVIPPNDFPNAATARLKDTAHNEAVLNDTERMKIVSGENLFYVWGRVTYYDVFGSPHKTLFCAVMNPDLSTFHACKQNYADAD